MCPKNVAVNGGEEWEKRLKKLVGDLQGYYARAGILEGATYTDTAGGAEAGMPVAQVAYWQEYGAEIEKPARTQTMYFKQNKDGTVKNRFVKKSQSNFSQDAAVAAHTIIIPSRPFMRQTVAEKKEEWANTLADALTGQTTKPGIIKKAMLGVGQVMKADIQATIEGWESPPSAPATIARKAKRGKQNPNTPLRDTGTMEKAVSYEVANSREDSSK